MNKPLLGLVVAAIAVATLGIVGSTVTEARENRMAKCSITAARAAETPPGPALVANVSRAMTPIDLNAVLMTDKPARRSVVVEGLFAQRTEMDTLQVTARFFNCTKKPIAIQVRSNFMDDMQIPTEPASVWKSVFISPRSIATYQETSIGQKKVGAYLVELRSSQ